MRYPGEEAAFFCHDAATGYKRDQTAGGVLNAPADESLGWIELVRAREGMLPLGQGRPRQPIEAYLGPGSESVVPGGEVALHASSSAPRVAMAAYKEPSGEEALLEAEFDAALQPIRRGAWWRGAGWGASHTFRVPPGWASGVYRLELRDASGQEPFVHCVLLCVRAASPGSGSRVLFKLATNSYYAYNNWGGHSLYGFHSIRTWEHESAEGAPAAAAAAEPKGGHRFQQEGTTTDLISGGGLQSHRVSAYRPGHGYYGSLEGRFLTWERLWLLWAEREGIEVDFATDEDVREWPEAFDNYRVLVSVGHDEYYSGGQRAKMEAFADRGGNIAFFSGNLAVWNVRWAPDGEGEPIDGEARATEVAGYPFVAGADTDDVEGGTYMVCYKQFIHRQSAEVKATPLLCTGLTTHPLVYGPPLNAFTGLSVNHGGYHRSHGQHMHGSGAFTLQRDDWMLEGTGLAAGDLLGSVDAAVVGYETDGAAFVLPEAGTAGATPLGGDGTPENLTIVGLSFAADGGTSGCAWGDEFQAPMPQMEQFEHESAIMAVEAGVVPSFTAVHKGSATLAYYKRGEGGGTVINTGCTDWSFGLAADEKVARVTLNIMQRLAE